QGDRQQLLWPDPDQLSASLVDDVQRPEAEARQPLQEGGSRGTRPVKPQGPELADYLRLRVSPEQAEHAQQSQSLGSLNVHLDHAERVRRVLVEEVIEANHLYGDLGAPRLAGVKPVVPLVVLALVQLRLAGSVTGRFPDQHDVGGVPVLLRVAPEEREVVRV